MFEQNVMHGELLAQILCEWGEETMVTSWFPLSFLSHLLSIAAAVFFSEQTSCHVVATSWQVGVFTFFLKMIETPSQFHNLQTV